MPSNIFIKPLKNKSIISRDINAANCAWSRDRFDLLAQTKLLLHYKKNLTGWLLRLFRGPLANGTAARSYSRVCGDNSRNVLPVDGVVRIAKEEVGHEEGENEGNERWGKFRWSRGANEAHVRTYKDRVR